MKTKTIVHRSAAPIYAAAVTWLLYGLLFPLYQVGHFLLAAAASAVVAIVARRFCRDVTEEVEIPEEPVTTGNPELDQMIRPDRPAGGGQRAYLCLCEGPPGEAAPDTEIYVLLPAHHHQAAAEL